MSLLELQEGIPRFGTNFGLIYKVRLRQSSTRDSVNVQPPDLFPVLIESFKYRKGEPKLYKQENDVVREFCDNRGSFTRE